MTSVSELNKRKVRLFVEAVWNQGRLELVDELVGADYLGNFSWLHEGVIGPEGVRRLVSTSRRQSADLYVKIEDQIAEHDLVVTRWRATARASDAHAATSCRGSCSGISVIRLLAGKQVDSDTAVSGTIGVAA
ncbi:MAG: ester cyclase [Solirubrobacteraceae bacterium]